MRNIVLLLAMTMLVACNSSKKSKVFDSDKLRGKYQVDITPFINHATKDMDGEDDKWGELGKGLTIMALSSINIEFNFYDNNKGVMHFDAGVLDAFSDENQNKTEEFIYEVRYDSLLYWKPQDSTKYEQLAIIRKYSDSYDYIKLLVVEAKMDTVYFNLKKINE